MHTIDHTTGGEVKDKRNALVESARITRGEIEPLDMLETYVEDFDAVIFPGYKFISDCLPLCKSLGGSRWLRCG